jgi:hypothetical protein
METTGVLDLKVMSVEEQETLAALGGMEVVQSGDGSWSWRQKLFCDALQGRFETPGEALLAAALHAATTAMADNDIDEAAWLALTDWQRAKLVKASWGVPSDLVLAA